jgi:4-hydroxy-tetrahydrodipicolinate reductase
VADDALARIRPFTSVTLRVGIVGGTGRMGQALITAARHASLDVVGALGRAVALVGTQQSVAALAGDVDVLIDFSAPDALADTLAAAERAKVAVVVGTTGLLQVHHRRIDTAAETIPVLQAANTALGINVLAGLVRAAAARLGPGWDIEILEMHHRDKVDAPSGTALLLGEAAAAGRGIAPAGASVDRSGRRLEGSIGYASLRGGSVAGDHMVVLAGPDERIELGHRAESRAIFARGAVHAARWLAGRAAGRYTMADVLEP